MYLRCRYNERKLSSVQDFFVGYIHSRETKTPKCAELFCREYTLKTNENSQVCRTLLSGIYTQDKRKLPSVQNFVVGYIHSRQMKTPKCAELFCRVYTLKTNENSQVCRTFLSGIYTQDKRKLPSVQNVFVGYIHSRETKTPKCAERFCRVYTLKTNENAAVSLRTSFQETGIQ